MAARVRRSLQGLASTRDLRAEMLALAGELAGNESPGELRIAEPVLDEETLRREWTRLLPAFAPAVRKRLALVVDKSKRVGAHRDATLVLARPNYRYEVLRQLLAAHLRGAPVRIPAVTATIGASATPVYAALDTLTAAGIVRVEGRAYEIPVADLSTELLAKLDALPQTLRFRHVRGAPVRAPAALAQRAMALLRKDGPPEWQAMALSGVPVAHADVRKLDVAGLPRVDLIWQPGRDAKAFDAALVRRLDEGLEPESNPLAPAPLVITIARAATPMLRVSTVNRARAAQPADVALSLIDLGLRRQAMQYAEAVRG